MGCFCQICVFCRFCMILAILRLLRMCEYLMTSHCALDIASFMPILPLMRVRLMNIVSTQYLMTSHCELLVRISNDIVSTQYLMTSHCELDLAYFCPILGIICLFLAVLALIWVTYACTCLI